MQKDLYFDIVSDEWSGALYQIQAPGSKMSFYYHSSVSDLETGNTIVSETNYPGFSDFWKDFLLNKQWFTLHPLYIHPEQRQFIKEELGKANWNSVADEKWRDLYQRQWNKVLNNPAAYYKPLN